MGTWRCYCALCSGPLHDTRRVTREDSEPDDSFGWEAYRPELIQESEWLDKVRCLGINPESKEPYISGNAEPWEYGEMDITVGDDPNQPEDASFKRAYEDNEADGHVFPFHDMCYDILKGIIANASGKKEYAIDRFVLFKAMNKFVRGHSITLDIDCLKVRGSGQGWEEDDGEEFTVAKPAFLDHVQAAIVSKLLDGSLVPRDISRITASQRSTTDPFRTLSQNLLFYMTRFLSVNDMLALSTASWPFLVATSSNSLWKPLLHREMPWAANKIYELVDIAFKNDKQDDSTDKQDNQGKLASERDQESCKPRATSVDYKTLMLWLDYVVKPEKGVDAPWVYLANRRRICRVCQIVANQYWDELGGKQKEAVGVKVREWPDSLLGDKYITYTNGY